MLRSTTTPSTLPEEGVATRMRSESQDSGSGGGWGQESVRTMVVKLGTKVDLLTSRINALLAREHEADRSQHNPLHHSPYRRRGRGRGRGRGGYRGRGRGSRGGGRGGWGFGPSYGRYDSEPSWAHGSPDFAGHMHETGDEPLRSLSSTELVPPPYNSYDAGTPRREEEPPAAAYGSYGDQKVEN